MRILACSLAVGLLTAVALTGCGGGGTSTSETPKPATATTAPAAAPATAPAPAAGTTQSTPPTTAAGAKEGGDEDLAAPLLAWADSDTDEGKAPLAVQFTADVEGGKAPLTYTWKFGDGTPDSSEANPKHTYAKAGTYRADLEVKDSSGDSDSDYLEITVE